MASQDEEAETPGSSLKALRLFLPLDLGQAILGQDSVLTATGRGLEAGNDCGNEVSDARKGSSFP